MVFASMDEGWSCSRCGEPVGVYERAVIMGADGPRTTSRAREPGVPDGEVFHEECWAAQLAEHGEG